MTRHQHASDLLSRSSKPADCKAGPWNRLPRAVLAVAASLALLAMPPKPARADGDLHKVNHIIIAMMENHSFDNYLGTLPYVPSGPYHHGPCKNGDHKCVDGLACTGTYGSLTCSNSNADDSGSAVHSFHEPNYCVFPDLDHEWADSHAEANFMSPNDALIASPNDGFVRMNDLTDQPDLGGERATEDETMGYYTQADLPFYYSLAGTFAIDDRYFSSVLGPTFPNRSYFYAATSFGHVLAIPDEFPPAGGYKPITGTIFDLLNNNHVTWANYFADVPATLSFLDTFFSPPHVVPVAQFFTDAATGNLPSVAFVDPSFGFGGFKTENDEHPPTDIRKGQYFVSLLVQAVRNSPEWKDSIVFIVYDEAGGAYDHVAPPKASQSGLLSPDLTNPGLCEDLSNPPASLLPGGGANCAYSLLEAEVLCPTLAISKPGYPAACANFNQLGFRVPFIAVSPFSKPHYVSHTVGDHTSLLALIEKRFLHTGNVPVNAQLLGHKHDRHHLTARDQHAHTLEDMFDFNHSPSLNKAIPAAPTPSVNDPNCAMVF
jgi:phospholipase C